MIKKLIYTFIFTLSPLIFSSNNINKQVYKAELRYKDNYYGFIDIPYTVGDTKLVIDPKEILAEIDRMHENSYISKPSIGYLHPKAFYSSDQPFEIPMPEEQNPLRFFLEFRLDSGAYSSKFCVFDDNYNILKEGDIISVNQKFKVFKDPFDGKLFIKLNTYDAFSQTDPIDNLPDIKTLIKDGRYTINSSEQNATCWSYMPWIFVGLLVIITNFCTYKITAQKNKSDSLDKNQ